MMNSLYISDLDGTLLTPQAALSPFAAEHLQRLLRGGLHFTVATARTWESTRLILKDVLPLPAPIVLQNGALVFDTRTGSYIKKEIIPEETVLELLCIVKAHGQAGVLYSILGDRIRLYHEDLARHPVLQGFLAARVPIYGGQITETPDLAAHVGEDAVYLMTQGAYDELTPLRDAIEGLPGIAHVLSPDDYLPGNWYFECFSASATKYNAARFLRERYGYDRVVGFGDNLNDVPLFRACDEAWAVSNAREELKAVATGVIGANADDGVVRFLLERTTGRLG